MKLNINEKSNNEKEVKRYILVDDSDNKIVDFGVNQAVIEIGAKQYIKNAIKSGKNPSVSCYTYVKTFGTDNGEVSESLKFSNVKNELFAESQASSSAILDFQEFTDRLQEYVDDNGYTIDVKGTHMAGGHYDSFEVILYSSYEHKELTTIMLEHSNTNIHDAWTATFDYDGEYDDASATYLDDLFGYITEWIDRVGTDYV